MKINKKVKYGLENRSGFICGCIYTLHCIYHYFFNKIALIKKDVWYFGGAVGYRKMKLNFGFSGYSLCNLRDAFV